MEIGEKPFPRGGKKPALHKLKKSSFSVFGKSKTKVKKKNKKSAIIEEKKKSKNVIKNPSLSVKFVDELNFSSIQEGMLLLGIVCDVTEKVVSVSLPGNILGIVTIPNISEFYGNMLQNFENNQNVVGLKEMFQVGDILPTKVLSASDKNKSLLLTCDPKEINSKLSYNIIEEGLILCGSVKSKEDHGYIIDFAIEKMNGFLHFDKVNKERELNIGQIVRCAIIKCLMTSGSCNVQCSMLVEDMDKCFIKEKSSVSLFCYQPGFQFEIGVTKTLKNGIEVTYGKGSSSKGYIHEDHFHSKFTKLSDVVIGSRGIATLLYMKPLVNIPYFKILPKKLMKWPFKFGEIVAGKVLKARRGGILVKVVKGTSKAKCFIPITKLKNTSKVLEGKSDIESLYPVSKKLQKIRLGTINYMNGYYYGATDKCSLEEKYFAVSDLKCGEIVTGIISSFLKKTAHVKIGKTITGIVGFTDMTDVPLKNPMSRFKVGQKVKARVLEVRPEIRFVRLTLKPTLLKEKKILDKLSFNESETYLGVVFKVNDNKLIVRFFNSITGVVPKHLTCYPDSISLEEHFQEGQLVKCRPLFVKKNNNIALSMLMNVPDSSLKVGNEYKVTVVNRSENGLLVDIQIGKKSTCNGYLPKELLTIHQNLSTALLATYSVGEVFSAYCVFYDVKQGLPVMGILEIFKEHYKENLINKLTVDSVLPFLFKGFIKNSMLLHSLVPEKGHSVVRVMKHDFRGKLSSGIPLKKYQLLYGKILSIREEKVLVSIKITDVWEKDFHKSLEFLDSYLRAMTNLVNRQKIKLQAYSESVSLGCFVKGVIEEIRTRHAIIKLEDGDLGLVEGKFSKNQELTGTIVWVNGPEQMIHVAVSSNPMSPDTENPFDLEQKKINGKVVFISGEVIVVQLRGRAKGKLAFLPRKRHINDMDDIETPYSTGDDIFVWVTKKESDFILGIDSRIVALQERVIWKNSEKKLKDSIVSLKRKLESEKLEWKEKRRRQSESDDLEIVEAKLAVEPVHSEVTKIKQEIEDDDDGCNDLFNSTCNSTLPLEYDDIEIKSENEEDIEGNETSITEIRNEEKIPLSSSSDSENEEESSKKTENPTPFKVGFNWSVLNDNALLSGVILNKENQSSDDDDDEEDSKNDKKKKRRLTASERREKSKTEEERLRSIEERLMDPDREPETIDDFDRAVLANPDSSALWLKYMAFHIQGTEIEAARTVARRALKAISFREEQEKLNIWIALLNLESLYGSEESLTKTLGEALQYNEPYKIHIHMLNLHGQRNKLQEMEKLGIFMLRKYKDVENMWCDVGTAFFSVGKIESARNVLQRALAVANKKLHVLIISKFAHLENKYGSPERAQTLYESILSSFPKRVDVWSCYVDMLVKSKHIDLARQVLERATSQSLRPRKMKTLFKKFITFEENHGTPETVEKVREAAVEYVQTVGDLNRL